MHGNLFLWRSRWSRRLVRGSLGCTLASSAIRSIVSSGTPLSRSRHIESGRRGSNRRGRLNVTSSRAPGPAGGATAARCRVGVAATHGRLRGGLVGREVEAGLVLRNLGAALLERCPLRGVLVGLRALGELLLHEAVQEAEPRAHDDVLRRGVVGQDLLHQAGGLPQLLELVAALLQVCVPRGPVVADDLVDSAHVGEAVLVLAADLHQGVHDVASGRGVFVGALHSLAQDVDDVVQPPTIDGNQSGILTQDPGDDLHQDVGQGCLLE
mmetsp:Transcript_62189/g.131389  ORF Transcript_62189/g.131389 Transcript_62189/m.131389 type:complete len:268 (-) Transcript_62189:1509-2312(-)